MAQALRITKEYNFVDMTQAGQLYVVDAQPIDPKVIQATPRIGIRVGLDKLRRFVRDAHKLVAFEK